MPQKEALLLKKKMERINGKVKINESQRGLEVSSWCLVWAFNVVSEFRLELLPETRPDPAKTQKWQQKDRQVTRKDHSDKMV